MPTLRNSYKDRWLLRAVRNSMLTALAMDSLGTILEDYKPGERLKWLSGERTSYPKPRKVRKASFNTDFTVLMLTVFTQVVPTEKEDILLYREELSLALQSYYYAVASPRSNNRYVRVLRGESDTGIVLPVGMLLGMYAAVMYVDRAYLYDLVDVTCKAMSLKSRDQDDVKFYAFLSYRLANDGYFGYQYFKELLSHKVVPPFVYRLFKEIMAHHCDVEYLTEPFYVHTQPGLSYAEQSLTEAMFYMCRVDSGFPKDVLPSGPKDQLADVFTSDIELSDIGFLYGGLCTLSEQNYSLVTKPLREGVYSRKTVDEFFKYVK